MACPRRPTAKRRRLTARRCAKRTTIWAACPRQANQQTSLEGSCCLGRLGYAVWSTQGNVREFRASLDDLIALTDDDPSTTPVLRDEFGNFCRERAGGTRPLLPKKPRPQHLVHLAGTWPAAGRQHRRLVPGLTRPTTWRADLRVWQAWVRVTWAFQRRRTSRQEATPPPTCRSRWWAPENLAGCGPCLV